ncbi:hypothetical protein DAEQUDRAFT_723104 [Daedalea quercina L-15889]|uniref:Uncharacterized protein n=1 Tax=Daedalea quercina L-15889 TaxID=1314783 RepID=A0A165SRV3_9APHY|nr:hypothetical protein DAEQUDRAFT_723104 [Daedalea quercina L-15889]
MTVDTVSYVGFCWAVYRCVRHCFQMVVSIDQLTLTANNVALSARYNRESYLPYDLAAKQSSQYAELIRRKVDRSVIPVAWTDKEKSIPFTFIQVIDFHVDFRSEGTPNEQFARAAVDLFNIGIILAQHIRFHFGTCGTRWNWTDDGRLDDALTLLAQERQGLEVTFHVGMSQDQDNEMADCIEAIATRLCEFTASGARARLVCSMQTRTGHRYDMEHQW